MHFRPLMAIAGFGFIAVAASATVGASSPPAERVVYADTNRPSLCNLAVVGGLRPGRNLLVRAGPTVNHSVVARLGNGARVYTCNERRPYVGVVFGQAGRTCGDQSFRSLDARRSSSCHEGWVHQQWLEVLTG